MKGVVDKELDDLNKKNPALFTPFETIIPSSPITGFLMKKS